MCVDPTKNLSLIQCVRIADEKRGCPAGHRRPILGTIEHCTTIATATPYAIASEKIQSVGKIHLSGVYAMPKGLDDTTTSVL